MYSRITEERRIGGHSVVHYPHTLGVGSRPTPWSQQYPEEDHQQDPRRPAVCDVQPETREHSGVGSQESTI